MSDVLFAYNISDVVLTNVRRTVCFCQMLCLLVSDAVFAYVICRVCLCQMYCLLMLDVDDCSDVICENGGHAVDTGKLCECRCVAGVTGEYCETG